MSDWYSIRIADPPSDDIVEHGTYAQVLDAERKWAGPDWPFAIIRHHTGQLVHLGAGYAYREDNERGYWTGERHAISLPPELNDAPECIICGSNHCLIDNQCFLCAAKQQDDPYWAPGAIRAVIRLDNLIFALTLFNEPKELPIANVS